MSASLGLTACQNQAESPEEAAPAADSAAATAAFNAMKSLVGTWEGTLTVSDGTEMPTSSHFRLVSGGNTIVETLMEGDVEMATTYTLEGGRMVTKHYCVLGTEPVFDGALDGEGGLDFTLSTGSPYVDGADDFVTSMSVSLPTDADGTMTWNAAVTIGGEEVTRTAVLRKTSDE